MDVRKNVHFRLAPFVSYDDYDGYGYLLNIRHGVLEELNERDTCMLSAILKSVTSEEAVHSLSLQIDGENLEMGISALLKRLESYQLLERQADNHPGNVPHAMETYNDRGKPFHPATLKQRIIGASHIVLVLNELHQKDGLYRAYQYIQKLKTAMAFFSTEAALQAVREEYWVYRIVTGLLERRVAHLLGQDPGEEGLCMVRAFAFCVYLLALNVPAQIVIGRPMYGSRNAFKLHVWVEMQGKPLNERPNVRDAYRVMAEFPF